MNSYLISIAGHNREFDGETLPTEIDITTIPEPFWPLFHALFGVETLTFKYFYAPVDEAIPDFEAAIQYSKDHEDELLEFIPAGEWRNVLRYRKVLGRMVKVMRRLGGVIAIGVVDDPAPVWEESENPVPPPTSPYYEYSNERAKHELAASAHYANADVENDT